MNAKELMIRDWVTYIPEIEEGEETYLGEPYNIQVDLPCLQKVDELIFYSIPLTTEILEKNEFQLILSSNGKNIYSHILGTEDCSSIIFLLIDEEKWKLNIKNCDSKKCLEFISFHNTLYVHELQHALRLCGFDDIADNFKV